MCKFQVLKAVEKFDSHRLHQILRRKRALSMRVLFCFGAWPELYLLSGQTNALA
jgi:hypothetical protein